MAESNAGDAGLSDPNVDIATMTTDDLRAEFVASAPEFTRLYNRRLALSAEIAKREKAADASALVQSMTQEQKDALKAALS